MSQAGSVPPESGGRRGASAPPESGGRRGASSRSRGALHLAAAAILSLGFVLLGVQPRALPGTENVPDTVSHAAAYALLSFTACSAAAASGVAPVWGAVYAVAHGGLLEGLQYLTPSRKAEWKDLAMDAVGAAVGLLVVVVRRRW